MPCNTETRQFTNLSNGMEDLFIAAAAAAGMPHVVREGGRIICADYEDYHSYRCHKFVTFQRGAGFGVNADGPYAAAHDQIRGEVVREYSKAAVSWAAKRAGWTVTAGTEANKLTLTRR